MTGSAKHAQGCLFCRRHDGGFRSREHIFSEALGNADYILERGIVCDRCNNGPLSRADHALTSFPPVTLPRAERGLPTKAGKPVVSKWGNAILAFSAPGKLDVYGAGTKALGTMPRGDSEIPPGGAEMHLSCPLPADRVRNIARSIWKSALELIYWDHGPDVAFNSAFDPAREAIVGRHKAHGWIVLPKEAIMRESVDLEYLPNSPDFGVSLGVRMSVFGLAFYTDALRRDVAEDEIDPPFPANVWTF